MVSVRVCLKLWKKRNLQYSQVTGICSDSILRKALEGKNPFTLDSKAPTKEYQEFIMGESRYINLKKQNPERAAKLFGEAEANAKAKYEALVKRAED